MTPTKFDEQACQGVLAKLDPYIDNELAAETNLELLGHLQRCAGCTQKAEEWKTVRRRLQSAVRDVTVPAGLDGRVRDRLRGARRSRTMSFNLIAIAATLAVCFGPWLTYKAGPIRLTTASQDSYVEAIASQVTSIMRVGLGDHLHCAVGRQRPSVSHDPVEDLPPGFRELVPIVHQRVPSEFPLILAHECRYKGRKFVHLTFRNNRNLVSLVVVRKQDGESLSQSGIPVHAAGVAQFQIAAVETHGYLIYTVSDLPRHKNLDLMAALAPALQDFLNRMRA